MDWTYVAGSSLSAVCFLLGFQLFAAGIAARARASETIGMAIHRLSYRGIGRHISVAMKNLKFWLWKRAHPDATFADFYAGSLAQRIRQGGSHRTLGAIRFYGDRTYEPGEQKQRGRKQFEELKKLGLRRDSTCIDYGCGSLRVGQHVIDYLAHGHYVGLDLVDTFFKEGLKLLPENLLRKSPTLRVIGDDSLRLAREAGADVVFSVAVLKHVPPEELDAYLARILSLLHPSTTILIDFEEGENGRRLGGNNWLYGRDFLLEKVLAHDCAAKVSFAPSRGKRTYLVIQGAAAATGCTI